MSMKSSPRTTIRGSIVSGTIADVIYERVHVTSWEKKGKEKIIKLEFIKEEKT